MAKILFLDESGDHSLSIIDPQFSVFVLCGIIMDEEYHQTVASVRLDAFKVQVFGNPDIVLHTADFTRNKSGFEAMSNHDFRTEFFKSLQDLIRSLEFRIGIHNFAIREKKDNIAGLQIADVVATPIGRHVMGKTTHPHYCDNGDFFSVVRPKFRQAWDGKIEGMGLVVLPK